MRKFYGLLVLCFVVLACNKNQVYREIVDLPEEHRWSDKDIQVHEFTIEEMGAYSVYLNVSHVRGTEMTKFPLQLEVTKPNGSVEKATLTVDLSKTDCVGDICDVKFPIKENLNLEKGSYKISYYPQSQFGFIPNILAVGLVVEKAIKK